MAAGSPSLRTLVYEREDFEEASDFYVTPDGGMNVPGPGSLDTLLLVVSNTDSFGVHVETEGTALVSDSFSRLSEYSDELSHVSAYVTSTGDRVLAVSEFPYRDLLRARVTVQRPVSVKWVRAVYRVGLNVDY